MSGPPAGWAVGTVMGTLEFSLMLLVFMIPSFPDPVSPLWRLIVWEYRVVMLNRHTGSHARQIPQS